MLKSLLAILAILGVVALFFTATTPCRLSNRLPRQPHFQHVGWAVYEWPFA